MNISITNLVTDSFSVNVQELYSIAIINIDFNTGNITIKDDVLSSSTTSFEPKFIYFTGKTESLNLTTM